MQKIIDGIFGKIKTPEEHAKEWKRKLREQGRSCDREVRRIEREEQKVKNQLKLAAKTGDQFEIKTLAGELVRSKKAKNRLHVAKANLNSIQLQLNQQMSEYKVLGAFKKSTDIMKMMNQIISIPELQESMRQMTKEMEKMGVIEDMVENVMEDTFEVDEDEQDEVIDAVLKDVLGDQLTKAKVGTSSLETKKTTKEDISSKLPEELNV